MVQLKKKLAKLKHVRITINPRKRKGETMPPAPPIPIPRGYITVERTALYEPFAHAVVVQNPSTGEYKYILDELPLDEFERDIYNRILEILLAEIRSPREEIKDPRTFFDREAKKVIEKYRISLGWLS
jgi:hypothetical protein